MKHLKEWLIGATAIFAIAATAFGYIHLPQTVKEVRAEGEENKEAIDKLANSVDKYVAVQKIKEEMEEKRDEQYQVQQTRLIDIIEQLADR